jgi:sulfide:quinone oxidoreductase
MIKSGSDKINHLGSMGNLGAACIASTGYGILKGRRDTITTNPIVPDY